MGADAFTLDIVELAHDGRGIGFISQSGTPCKGWRGKAVFVAGCIPGQTVVCRPIRNKSDWMEAAPVKVLQEGDATSPLCPHHAQCGGCSLQRMPYQSQLFWKDRLARQAMLRIGKLGSDELEAAWKFPFPSPLQTCYRNKLELAFGHDRNGKLVLGFRKAASHEICDIESCALVDDVALRLARTFKDQVAGIISSYRAHRRFLPKFLILRKGISPNGNNWGWWIICITGSTDTRMRNDLAYAGRALLSTFPEAACFIHEESSGNGRVPHSARRISIIGSDSPILRIPLGAHLFQLDPDSFFQVNDGSAHILANIAQDMATTTASTDASLLDLYCGVGAPGQLIASQYKNLTGIECDKAAIKQARANALSAGLENCAYVAANTGTGIEVCSKNTGKWQTILADPPRAGIDARTMKVILDIAPRNIIYISCNPSTLARDSAILANRYRPLTLASVDMFPHTPHLECCTLWQRRDL